MNILIDIGHPAHVHFYRNFIAEMQKDHRIFVFARDKEVTLDLLRHYGIPFVNRGSGGRSGFQKFLYLLSYVCRLVVFAVRNKIDVLTGIGNPYVAMAGFFTGRKSIVFNDTEHASTTVRLVRMFATTILTPQPYFNDEGPQHLRYAGYHELAYLHPNRFAPNAEVLQAVGIDRDKPFVLLRFVAWKATHDIGQQGIPLTTKVELVNRLRTYGHVYISSEETLPEELQPYQLRLPPEKILEVLAFARLYIGEGATMASECAVLGTPAIYVNTLNAGTLEEQQQYGLIVSLRNGDELIAKALELLTSADLLQKHQRCRQKMLAEKMDVTAFMLWFFRHYPQSVDIMRQHPAALDQFRSAAPQPQPAVTS